MRFYFNEASVRGQFENDDSFLAVLEPLLKARTRSPVLREMRTTPALADRPVSHDRNVRQVVQAWRGSPLATAMLTWVGNRGPFIEDDRLPEQDDLFQCLGEDITDGGLGEAARRQKAQEAVATISFAGGDPDFSLATLPVIHGLVEAPIATYPVTNFWDVDAAVEATIEQGEPASNWQAMVAAARLRFPNLLLPNTLYEDRRLAREPFEAAIRDRFYALLSLLDAYMRGRDERGIEGPGAQEILRTHFQGERALFSPESATNLRDHRADMTFPDPDGGSDVLAHWHGKISHRYFRLHFEWPVAAESKQLKVLYIGPKLTKE